VRVAPSVTGASSQWAEIISTAAGRGMAAAQAASSPIQPASSSSGGAPWARKIDGMRPDAEGTTLPGAPAPAPS
jgi:hypothetical protein